MKQSKMTSQASGKARSDQRIGPGDWVRAGLELMAEHGIDAVRVEPLAVRLGVTKGSFYWHFKDRPALYAAMLEAWHGLNTGDIIERVEAGGGTGAERLGRLIELTTSNNKAARLETALRAWARSESRAAEALADVDRKRLDYVARLLVANGLKRDVSKMRAKLLYLSLIGSFFADKSAELDTDREIWRGFVSTVIQ